MPELAIGRVPREFRGSIWKLSARSQLFLGFGALSLYIASWFLTPYPWLTSLAILGVGVLLVAMSDALFSLLLYLVVLEGVTLQPARLGKASVLDVVAGLIMVGLCLWWFFKVKILDSGEFSKSWEHLLIIIYFVWTLSIGIAGMVVFNNTASDWLREILIQLPIVIVPFLYVRAVESDPARESKLQWVVVVMWIALIITGLVQFRSNVVKAFYFYQTGRTQLGVTSAVLLFYSCVSFVAIETKKKRIKWYSLAASLAALSIGLSLYRTVWVACILAIPIVVSITSRPERKQIRRFSVNLTLMLLAALAVAYFEVRLVRLFVQGLISRFGSTANVTTDLSLLNRYVEWGRILIFIKQSPLVGFGFGAHYLDYDWLKGVFEWAGYSHNAYLFELFKSGIFGFVALYTAYIGLLIRGIRIARSRFVSERRRAVARIAVLFSFFILVTSLTLNSFAEREALFWLAVGWGAILVGDREARIAKLRSEAGLRRSASMAPSPGVVGV